MCGLFLLNVEFRFRRLLVVVYVWRKFVGPLFCYGASSTFERKLFGPPRYVGDARTRLGGTVCLGQRFSVCLE